MSRASRVSSLAVPILALAAWCSVCSGDEAMHVPTGDDLLSLRLARGATLSPDARFVAYGVMEADFRQDAFVTRSGWLPRRAPFLLTGGRQVGRQAAVVAGRSPAANVARYDPFGNGCGSTLRKFGDTHSRVRLARG